MTAMSRSQSCLLRVDKLQEHIFKKCVVNKLRSRSPVRAQFVKAGRVTKPVPAFNCPTFLRNPPSENVFGSDQVDKLPPAVARRAAIALLLG